MSSIEIVDLYRKAQDDVKFNGDKAWETIKFCVSLLSTLITITVGLIGVINYLSIDVVVKALLTLSLISVIITMLKIVDVTEINFDRECRRMYESMAIIMKIEDELPLRKDLGDRNFKQETEYIPDKWKKTRFLSTKAYVNAMMERKDTLSSNMRRTFPIFRWLSYALLIIVIVIVIITVAPIILPLL